MKTITAAEFQQSDELDPAWGSKLSELVEITNFSCLCNLPITHLSPILHFTGRNIPCNEALIQKCRPLEVSETVAFSPITDRSDQLANVRPSPGLSVLIIDSLTVALSLIAIRSGQLANARSGRWCNTLIGSLTVASNPAVNPAPSARQCSPFREINDFPNGTWADCPGQSNTPNRDVANPLGKVMPSGCRAAALSSRKANLVWGEGPAPSIPEENDHPSKGWHSQLKKRQKPSR